MYFAEFSQMFCSFFPRPLILVFFTPPNMFPFKFDFSEIHIVVSGVEIRRRPVLIDICGQKKSKMLLRVSITQTSYIHVDITHHMYFTLRINTCASFLRNGCQEWMLDDRINGMNRASSNCPPVILHHFWSPPSFISQGPTYREGGWEGGSIMRVRVICLLGFLIGFLAVQNSSIGDLVTH